MAFAPVAVSAFPNVPAAPGVPPLNRIGGVLSTVVAVVSDVALLLRALRGPQWGVFDAKGKAVITADSVVSMDYRSEYRVADYPIEGGGFASYNKVPEPFDVRISFASSGKGTLLSNLLSGGVVGALITGQDKAQANRAAFLTSLGVAINKLDLYTVTTPEKTYPSCNVVHFDFRRDVHAGVTVLTVDVWLREVRITAPAKYTQTKTPAGADPVSTGTTQPATPTPAQTRAPDGVKAFDTPTVVT